ncbi:hypothetical protein Q3G72_034684 [Acer saccharum]|nr:hypothetical protein Q3G72_034684 [Acer saccharum]
MTTKWKVTSSPDMKSNYHSSVVLLTVLILLPILQTFNFPNTAAAAVDDSYEEGKCGGSMAECGAMESEISKRVLRAAPKFISPGALKNNLPVCGAGARGDPYSKSCLSSPVNKYQRGCSKYYSFLLLLLLTLLLLNEEAAAAKSSLCNDSIAKCNEEFEMLMESEISKRFLQEKKYITPGALKPDQPVCNGGARGQSYSKSGGCLPPSSNPYNRGCSQYYRCRSGS